MSRNTIPSLPGLGRALTLAGWMLLAAAPGLAAQNGGPERSTAEGVFTEEQAARGEETFDEVCAACHFSRQFRGRFLESWTGSTAFSLYQTIQQTMPQNRPGSLSPQQYTDIVAYFLEMNGMPVGSSPLAPEEEALKNVLIEGSSNR